MYYYIELDTPPNTVFTAPVEKRITLNKGLLEFVDIGIPDWVSRLAKCKILLNSIQILPWNRDMWFTGDNVTVRVPLNIELNEEPYEITVLQYNTDDTFLHQYSYGFSVDVGTISNVAQLQQLGQFAVVQSGGA